MPKYLIEASYTSDGPKGPLKDGGSKRRQAAEQGIQTAGGKLVAFHFAVGRRDAFLVVDAPDHATVAAASLAVNASGAVHTKTVVLLTPEELDAASKKGVKYTPPGH